MESKIIREPSFTDDQMADIERCCATLGAENAKAIDWDIVASAINARNPERPRIDAEECRDIVNFYMRKNGYRESQIDASATPQRADDMVREEVEPKHQHAKERQNSIKPASLPNYEAMKSQEESKTTFRDGKIDSEEVGRQKAVNIPQSPESLSKPPEQDVDHEDGPGESKQSHQPLTTTTRTNRTESSSCSTM